MTAKEPDYYTVKSLAERWECHPATVRRMCRHGRLRYFVIGENQLRIPASEVARAEGETDNGTDPLMEALNARQTDVRKAS